MPKYIYPYTDDWTRPTHRRAIEFGFLIDELSEVSAALRERFPDLHFTQNDYKTGDRQNSAHPPLIKVTDDLAKLGPGNLDFVFLPEDWQPEWRFESPRPRVEPPEWRLLNLPWPRAESGRPHAFSVNPFHGAYLGKNGVPVPPRPGLNPNMPPLAIVDSMRVMMRWPSDDDVLRKKAHALLRAMEQMTTQKVTIVDWISPIDWYQTTRSRVRCSAKALAWAAAGPLRLAGFLQVSGCLPHDCNPAELGFIKGR